MNQMLKLEGVVLPLHGLLLELVCVELQLEALVVPACFASVKWRLDDGRC
jgi:hypothetical protein